MVISDMTDELFNSTIERIKVLDDIEDKESCREILHLMRTLPVEDQKAEIFLHLKANCLMELEEDQAAAVAYIECLERHPEGTWRKENTRNLALCLENLTMDEEALALMVKVGPGVEADVKRLQRYVAERETLRQRLKEITAP